MQANGTSTLRRNVRKAAILLASLDGPEADLLLRRMSPAQAHVVRQAMVELDELDPAERDEVIEEFYRSLALVPVVDVAGLSLDEPPPVVGRAENRRPTDDTTTPFRFLHEAAPRKLAPFLEREHPQTVAVVLSHLPAPRAAEILAHLSASLQVDVARRLASLEETDPEVLREVERGLESWLCAQGKSTNRSAAGATPLSSILGAADPHARQSILANLARHDRRLADQIETPETVPPSFADLENLDTKSLTVVLRRAEPLIVARALAGAAPQFADRAWELIEADGQNARAAREHAGPARIAEVEEAQQALAELARRLEQRGEIVPEPWNRLSLAG